MGEKLLPFIFKEFEAQEGRKARKEELGMRLTEMRASKEEARAARKAEKETFSEKEQNIWMDHERESLKKSKAYQFASKISAAKNTVQSALKNPSAFGDVATLYSAIRALDPDSVVREGEVALARSGLGLWGEIETGLKRYGASPRLLNRKMLSDIKKYVDLLDDQAQKRYDIERQSSFAAAEAKGIPESKFGLIDPLTLLEQKEKSKQTSGESTQTLDSKKIVVKKGYNAQTNQTQLIYSDGSKEIVSGRK
jgi:hypothetical protein